MRYDTKVYFQLVKSGAYDPETGNYGADTVEETLSYASVESTKIDTMRIVYGEVRQGSKTIHLQNRHTGVFNRIRIGDTLYAIDARIPHRVKEAFIISEMQ